MEFKLADIYTDAVTLKKVSEDVDRLLAGDEELARPEHVELKKKLTDYLKTSLDTLNL